MKDFMSFVFEELARLFETPCSFSPADKIMLNSNFCEKHCGDIPDSECWKKYFEILYQNQGENNKNKGDKICDIK